MRRLLFSILTVIFAANAYGQCTFKNTAFKGGEYLTYNLYYNWKFIWVKAGTASMSTVETVYNGKKAYRTSLMTRGNGRLDDFFVLRDTLLGYTTLDLAPLYYRKGAREGKRYTVDEAFLLLFRRQGGSENAPPEQRRHSLVGDTYIRQLHI